MLTRKCTPSFADLIDSLTVAQIKEVTRPSKFVDEYEKEIADLMHDIGIDIEENELTFSAYFVRLIIALAQINLFIWEARTKTGKEDRYKYLKLAHQLNGIRNQLRNKITEEINHQPSEIRTNINTDGLEGWKISI